MNTESLVNFLSSVIGKLIDDWTECEWDVSTIPVLIIAHPQDNDN